MRFVAGFVISKVVALAILVAALAAGCATTGPNPCIGKMAVDLPCQCPATANPGCEPWITDEKRPTPDGGTAQ